MKLIRKFLEKISRNKVIKRNIIIKSKQIDIFVSPDSQLKYLNYDFKKFDTGLVKIAETFVKPTSNIWDLGSNVGIFGLSSSVISNGQILCIEPDLFLGNLIERSIDLNQNICQNTYILPIAISSQINFEKFIIAKRGRASNSLLTIGGRDQIGGIRKTKFVPTFTLDYLIKYFKPPDFIKIDVEGAEKDVLLGSNKIINKYRPIFYIEVDQKSREFTKDFFLNFNYKIYSIQNNELVNNIGENSFFIPDEKKSDIKKINSILDE